MERRLVLTILALAALSLLTQILVWIIVPREHEPAFVGPPRSDYTLSDFKLNVLDADGRREFSVTAPRLARKQSDDSLYVTTPDYELLDSANNVWKGTSDSAWINKDGTIFRLEGKVQMHRVPSDKVTPIRVLTSDLTVTSTPHPKGQKNAAPQERKMRTDALTTIIAPDDVAHGVGMRADLEMKTVELLSDVHWISIPHHRAD